MGENIADFAGIQVALDAYHRSLNGKPAPVIDGLTGDQRFFLSWAQVAREAARGRAAQPGHDRSEQPRPLSACLGPIRNVDAWHQAFNVQPGNSMYIPPEQRAKIW